jgi:hypothetical protein
MLMRLACILFMITSVTIMCKLSLWIRKSLIEIVENERQN